MPLNDEKEKRIIDHYYGETDTPIAFDEEMKDFLDSMSHSLEQMEIREEESLSISIDSLIQEGLLRKEQKKQREELTSFILSALIIIFSLPLWMIVFGLKTILLWQWILLIPVTLVVLLVLKNGERKEVG
jgi:cation transport ATPase